MNLRATISDAVKSSSRAVGLAENPSGIRFHCGACEYFKDGHCHNKHPKLNGRKVESAWCCNLFDHDGMKVIIE